MRLAAELILTFVAVYPVVTAGWGSPAACRSGFDERRDPCPGKTNGRA